MPRKKANEFVYNDDNVTSVTAIYYTPLTDIWEVDGTWKQSEEHADEQFTCKKAEIWGGTKLLADFVKSHGYDGTFIQYCNHLK